MSSRFMGRVPVGALSGVLIASGLLQTVALDASAAESDSGTSDSLAEIVVTAQKRAQNLQDVGTANSAEMQRLGFTDPTDVVAHVPGLQYNEYAPTITVFNIRGVAQNDFGDHQEAPVAVYTDDVYVASMGAIAGNLYDLGRVEVLRGPQGTLFGRNATGGLIHYISQKPNLDDDGFIEVTGARFTTIKTDGAVNVKVSDESAVRLSFATNNSNGYLNNTIGPTAQNENNYAGRLQYLFKPSSQAEVLVKLYGTWNVNERIMPYSYAPAKPNAQGLGEFLSSSDDYWGTCPGCSLGGFRNPSSDVFTQTSSRTGVFNRSLYGATVHVNWAFDWAQLASVTDYQHMNKLYNDPIEASPTPVFIFYDTNQQYHQFSQELRLSGEQPGLRWVTGAYFLTLRSADEILSQFAPVLGGNVGDNYNTETHSWALFAQAEKDFTDELSGILGARYTQDHKTDNYTIWTGDPSGVVAGYPYNAATYPDADRTFHLPSWKAELDYKPAKDVLLYASINRGVKGGGWAQPAVPTDPQLLAHRPERLTDYEVGMKSTFLERRLRLNAAVFYYDYKDYQVFLQEGLAQAIGNRNARVEGGELELSFIPAKGWDAQIGVSGLNATVFNVALPDLEVADRIMPQAPKWSVNGEVGYKWQVPTGTMAIRADGKWDSDFYFSAFNAPVDVEKSHVVANSRAIYTNAAGNLDLTLFCKNLTDRRYRVYDLDISSIGFADQVYAPPRTYGGTVTFRW
jgi:iron complex outermembrane recepter protein